MGDVYLPGYWFVFGVVFLVGTICQVEVYRLWVLDIPLVHFLIYFWFGFQVIHAVVQFFLVDVRYSF